VEPSAAPQRTEKAVLAVLAGAPFHQAAAHVPIEPAELAAAIELYQAAGRAALQAQIGRRGWKQVHIEPADWTTAEHTVATHLGPQLTQAETTGIITTWWFIRKAPCWRLRWRLGTATIPAQMQSFIHHALDTMLAHGLITRWRETIYEPETFAFGGPEAMNTAHRLFHADSSGIIDYLNRHHPAAPPERTIGRRELSVLLCSVLLRAAAQDWHEQADIWNRVEHQRPIPPGMPMNRLRDITPNLRQLITVDAGPASKLLAHGGPLAFTSDWAAAFEDAGKELGGMARDGTLGRGVRDVLAHHVIFHWNRMGLSSRTQSILAKAARAAILGDSRTTTTASA
jgi:thiopeptide-type bacteriocin biosynthesis protein